MKFWKIGCIFAKVIYAICVELYTCFNLSHFSILGQCRGIIWLVCTNFTWDQIISPYLESNQHREVVIFHREKKITTVKLLVPRDKTKVADGKMNYLQLWVRIKKCPANSVPGSDRARRNDELKPTGGASPAVQGVASPHQRKNALTSDPERGFRDH